VQYAHARVASLFRVAESRGVAVPKPSEADLEVLTDPDEFTLVRKLSAYPSVVEGSALAFEPHRIVFYLQELAQLLHTFYFKHRILPPAAEGEATDAGQFVKDATVSSAKHREQLTPQLTGARLALMGQVGQVIRNGLGLLGVSAPERM
jgi:arginyl-tRNA synthetase